MQGNFHYNSLGVILTSRPFYFQSPDPAIYDNPAAGTVLDHSVCRRAWYDFYIVPMSVSLGTVTPTHFTVLYDSAPIPVDEFQRIAYAMTFMYFNWPGNVKVC